MTLCEAGLPSTGLSDLSTSSSQARRPAIAKIDELSGSNGLAARNRSSGEMMATAARTPVPTKAEGLGLGGISLPQELGGSGIRAFHPFLGTTPLG